MDETRSEETLYVALLTIVDGEANRRLRPEHLAYLDRLHREGKVVAAGPFADGQGGMVLYRASSEAQAREMAEADPVVRGGARTLALRAWRPLAFPLGEEGASAGRP